ncbi:ester hydrolase C11orf54 homolog isoform X2 [Cylas formicarius]|nr:ester hydrolase C11orf54 homolog isoform X2 [Cylas formicarius]
MSSLKSEDISVEKRRLHVPPLEELAKVFNSELIKNFEEVKVEVTDSPDLSQKPFTLADKGLNGKTKLIEIGGVPYLIPLVNKDKVYDLKDVANLIDSNPAFVIGAGAGPYHYAGVNCEGIINISIKNGTVNQQTRISKVVDVDEHYLQEKLPDSETRISLLGNFFASEGKSGKVVKVHAKKRTGSQNFIECLRNAIEKEYGEKLVGVGGTFLIANGKAKQHVMRDFSKTELVTDEDVNNWLKFYEMSAPLVAVGTFVSNDGGDLDLRVQHFHSFSHHGDAGHYHYDVTPHEVEYLGYFNTAEEIYRLDKPVETHKVGRD